MAFRAHVFLSRLSLFLVTALTTVLVSCSGSKDVPVAIAAPDGYHPTQFRSVSHLPLKTTFVGESDFDRITRKAQREGWARLPIGQRMTRIGREFEGVPYKGFTLEIDDHIESPSANFKGVDCWTFFEICLGMARMLESPQRSYEPNDLLREIEWTRYRGGQCGGNYLERIHYLAEWYLENDRRGVANDITRSLRGSERLYGRKIQEMSILWKSYRYLRENPNLRPEMAKQENYVAGLPFYYIPKSRVAAIEHKLQDGDILGIVTRHDGGFCSHVGIAIRTEDGVLRFMHASRNYKKVVIDNSISSYLNEFGSHQGLIVARPLPARSGYAGN